MSAVCKHCARDVRQLRQNWVTRDNSWFCDDAPIDDVGLYRHEGMTMALPDFSDVESVDNWLRTALWGPS